MGCLYFSIFGFSPKKINFVYPLLQNYVFLIELVGHIE